MRRRRREGRGLLGTVRNSWSMVHRETAPPKTLMVAILGSRRRPLPQTVLDGRQGWLCDCCDQMDGLWSLIAAVAGLLPGPVVSCLLAPAPRHARSSPIKKPGRWSPAALGRNVWCPFGSLVDVVNKLTDQTLLMPGAPGTEAWARCRAPARSGSALIPENIR